jgi:transposase
MYGREKRVLLRHFLKQGLAKTAVAEKLGVSRRTVYHWIETGQLDRELDDEAVRYRPRPPIPRKVDPYRGIIHSRLEEFPELSAVRLYEEIRAAGYEGSYTQVKEYVRQVRPRPEAEPLVRFETPPGHQAQVDFAHFRLPWGHRWALLVVLAYSRLLWLRFFRRQDMRTLFGGLEQAFGFFGGVPQEVLFDQMRSVIVEDRRSQGGAMVENPDFVRFAHHWEFRVRACRPYRAKTKGKVERPIRYVRESFFYGRHFLNDDDLDAQLERWLSEVANVRLHRTINERPQDRFERDEKAALKPLAVRPYHALVLPREHERKPSKALLVKLPSVEVERRPLQVYDRLAGGGR